MRATIMYRAGDVRIEHVPDPRIQEPSDAIIRVIRGCICGSDLWPYNSMEPSEIGQSMGHHAAVAAKVAPGKKVAVVGDGAVGLCGVIAAKRLGAEQIIILGRHRDRIALAGEFGATDVVSERGAEAIERVKELTGGHGVHSVLECVGLDQSVQTAIEIARPGGAVGRVGVPQHQSMPVRAYIEELMPDILDGKIEPGRV